MKKMKNQDILIEDILKDIETIPLFIDGKKHLTIWRLMQSVLYSILKLTKQVFLTENQVRKIHKEIEENLCFICIVDETEMYEAVKSYLIERLDEYYEKALELELYETVQNIKKYWAI